MQCNKFYKITFTQDRNSESGGWKLGEGRGKREAGGRKLLADANIKHLHEIDQAIKK